MKDKKVLYTLLSVSFLTIMASQLATSILGELRLEFADARDSQIKLIYTVVSLVSFLTSFLCGYLIRRKKRALMSGIFLFTVGGMLTGLAQNLPVLMFFRIITGIGAGIITPVMNGMISDLTLPEQRPAVLGKSSMFSQGGSIFVTLFAGFLAVYNWRCAFLLFLVGLLPLFLVHRYLPEIYVEKSPLFNPRSLKKQEKSHVPRVILGLTGLNFIFGCVYSTIFTNLSIWMQSLGIPTEKSGTAISMAALGAMLISPAAPLAIKKLGRNSAAFFWSMICCMFLILSFCRTALPMGIAMFGMGVFGCMLGILINTLAMQNTRRDNSVFYMSLVNSSYMLGGFVCPYVFDFTGYILHNYSVSFGFLINALEALVIGGVCFLVFRKSKAER